MSKRYVYLSGKGVKSESCDTVELLKSNYVYTRINTSKHRPLYLKTHLQRAEDSFKTMFGDELHIDTVNTATEIEKFLRYGHYPLSSNCMDIFLLENKNVILSHGYSTIYQGYALMSLRPEAVMVNYEIPFERHQTSMSYLCADYMERFAARLGAGIALRANRSGNLVSACDSPLFVEMDGRFVTPAIEAGGRASIERELLLELCRRAQIDVEECDIPIEQIPRLGEIAVFTPAGIIAAKSCSGHMFHNIFSLKIEPFLVKLNNDGLEDL